MPTCRAQHSQARLLEGDPANLGVTYPPNGEVHLHFTSDSPNLTLKWATKDGARSDTGYHLDNSDSISSKSDCAERFHIEVTRLPNGKYDYRIRLASQLSEARVELAGYNYRISCNKPPALVTAPVTARKYEEDEPIVEPAPKQPEIARQNTAVISPPVTPPQQPAVTLPPETAAPQQNATPPPAVTPQTLAQLSEQIKPVVRTVRERVGDFVRSLPPSTIVGDSHISDAAGRERNLIAQTGSAATRVLTPAQQAKIASLVTPDKLREGSREVRRLFQATLQAVNEQAAKELHIAPANDLAKRLGLPESTAVLLGISGLGPNSLSLSQVSETLDKVWGDIIRIRGYSPPLADETDLAFFQLYEHERGGQHFLSMSILGVDGTDSSKWMVTTRDASFRPQPERYISNAIDWSSEVRTETLADFRKRCPQLASSKAFIETLAACERREVERVKLATEHAAAEEARRKKAEAESALQSDVFQRVSNAHYRVGYQGTPIDQIHTSNAAFRAADNRTGTFRVEPDAGLTFQIPGPDGKPVRTTLDTISQLRAMKDPERKMFEFALTTPYENDAERSVNRVISLFPSDTYRPGSFGGLFYSPRYFKRELTEKTVAAYAELKTPAERRSFLKRLYSALSAAEAITEDTIDTVLSAAARR